MEHTAELSLVLETHLVGDHPDRLGCIQQQILGMKDTIPVEIIPGRDLQLLVKDAAEIILTDTNRFCDLPARDRSGIILVHMGDGLFHERAYHV
jgi:hypothetical protein